MSSSPLGGGEEIAPGYEVIRHMRRGRALDVYDIWSHELGARCVIKAVRPERLDDPVTRDRLLEEGRLLEQIRHPHIVRGYETLEEPQPMFAMETLSGATLGYLIDQPGEPLTIESAAHLGLHLGSAIRFLHARDILHLDLKPANIVAEGNRAKVIDLSVARAPGAMRGGVGTWCYLAPEQATDGLVGPPADVWGIGVVLFEAVTGEPAFDDPEEEDPDEGRSDGDEVENESGGDGDESWDIEGDDGPWSEPEAGDTTPSWLETGDGPYPQLERRASRIDELRDVPATLADLVEACLEPDPAARPTVLELLAALEPLTGLPAEELRWSRPSMRGFSPDA